MTEDEAMELQEKMNSTAGLSFLYVSGLACDITSHQYAVVCGWRGPTLRYGASEVKNDEQLLITSYQEWLRLLVVMRRGEEVTPGEGDYPEYSQHLHGDRTVGQIAIDVVRVAIEGLGNSAYERMYTVLDENLRYATRDTWVQIRAAALMLIEALRKDSPSNDARVAGLCLVWLSRNYPECMPLALYDFIHRMLPHYYQVRGKRDRDKPHRGYLVYEQRENNVQIAISSVLYHSDEHTQVTLYGRDESQPQLGIQFERVDRYTFFAVPGDRVRVVISRGQREERLEAWYTVTTQGVWEVATRSTLWLAVLRSNEVYPTRDGFASWE